jgi:predicted DNA repair protein MutK
MPKKASGFVSSEKFRFCGLSLKALLNKLIVPLMLFVKLLSPLDYMLLILGAVYLAYKTAEKKYTNM